jgi:signal transduction histidine kinase
VQETGSGGLRERAEEIAHDLRGPLAVVAGNAELLVRMVGSRLTEEEQGAMATLLSNVARMDAIIHQLLVVPTARPSYGVVDVDRVVGDVLHGQADTLRGLDAELHVGELGTTTGDGVGLYRIFQNLVDNAIRYRDRDRRLVLEIRARDDGDGRAFTVDDNGVGVGAVGDGGRGADRFGIGLRICRKIAEQHGGHITMASTADGTSVQLWLPGSRP